MKKLIKNKFLNKKNKKIDPIEAYQKDEELIEKAVQNHKDIFNWSMEDIQLLESLLSPNIGKKIKDQNIFHNLPFISGKISCFFDVNRSKNNNYVIGKIHEVHKKRIPKIEAGSTCISIQEIEEPQNDKFKKYRKTSGKKLLNLIGVADSDIGTKLDLFITERAPGTKVKLKLRKKRKITEVVLKLGSFDDFIVKQHNVLVKYGFTKKQADVWLKEWKSEFFYSGQITQERASEILKDKKIEYKPKTLIDRFLELESKYPVHNWDEHLLRRLDKIRNMRRRSEKINSKYKFHRFKSSNIDFYYSWPKSGSNTDLMSVKIQSYDKATTHVSGDVPVDGDVITDMKYYKNNKIVFKRKIKNQDDLNIFLSNVPPNEVINISFKRKTRAFTSTFRTIDFEESCKCMIKMYGKYYGNYSKAELIGIAYKKSHLLGYPDFTQDLIVEILKPDIEDKAKDKYIIPGEEDVDNKKIEISTSVKKEKIKGKEAFVVTFNNLLNYEELALLTKGDTTKIFLKTYIFDVTNLDNEKYNELMDNIGSADNYFSNNCYKIKTNDVSWSEGDMTLVQSKELKDEDLMPEKFAFPYSVMLLPKTGKRKLSFRTFVCTDKQLFDPSEGRPVSELYGIIYRPEEHYLDGGFGFDEYASYPEIISYDSVEIDAEYKQPGYLDASRKKYNELSIALGIMLDQLKEKDIKKNIEKIKEEIIYGDSTHNIHKSLNLKLNYERALKGEIDLDFVLKEIKKNARIDERYDLIDLLLNLAIKDETFSSKENEFIDKIANTLELNIKKFQEIKKTKTASVKYVNFGEKADESIFGITKDMKKEEKLKVLRKEYSRWNALTNNSDKVIRERAREMRDLAANIRKEYT